MIIDDGWRPTPWLRLYRLGDTAPYLDTTSPEEIRQGLEEHADATAYQVFKLEDEREVRKLSPAQLDLLCAYEEIFFKDAVIARHEMILAQVVDLVKRWRNATIRSTLTDDVLPDIVSQHYAEELTKILDADFIETRKD